MNNPTIHEWLAQKIAEVQEEMDLIESQLLAARRRGLPELSLSLEAINLVHQMTSLVHVRDLAAHDDTPAIATRKD